VARQVVADAIMRSANPRGSSGVAFLTDQYPATETKVIGWMQLTGDRAAMWLAGRWR
jgi:hypothetical protein